MEPLSTPPSLVVLSLLLVSFLRQLFPAQSLLLPADGGFRVAMTHVDSGGNFTKLQTIHRSLRRGRNRMARLMAATGAPVHAGEGEFVAELTIGTPTTPFPAIVDTGSDLVWTQCKPCHRCFKQATPVFDPSKSSTFAKLPCSGEICRAVPDSTCEQAECRYSYSYGDKSFTEGLLASETLGFGATGNVTISDVGFGCGQTTSDGGFSQASGIVGLGRGPLSLVTQLGLGQFSYCLTNFGDATGSPLLLGSLAGAAFPNKTKKGGGSTPLIRNPYQPSLYYLNLTHITVGGVVLSIPGTTFDGTGGTIIDSGTSITYLERSAFLRLKKAFLSQVQLPVADDSGVDLDVCFKTPKDGSAKIRVPKLGFHFQGADLLLPPRNYLVLDEGSGLLCLTVMSSSGLSIFGNFQQQNMQILYDLKNEQLSFAPARCDLL